MMLQGSRKKLSVYPSSPDSDGVTTWKALEYIFRKTDIKCLLHTARQGGKAKPQEGQKNKRRNTEALVINQTGKTYADLFKTLKDAVKLSSTPARAIRTTMETKKGKMVKILDKNAKAIKELKRELREAGTVNIRDSSREHKIPFINEIDELTTKGKVLYAIASKLSLKAEIGTVDELRKSIRGNQSTTVRLSQDYAERLIGKERIRIGLTWCLVREKVKEVRCFRCWQYGHFAKECKAKGDDSKRCRKCGEIGHVAKGCISVEYCLTCKTGGHRVGTSACPEFRKAISLERLKIRNKRRY